MREELKRILILALAVLAVLAALALVSARDEHKDLKPVPVTAMVGDSAWSIAKRYCPDDMDIREYLAMCAYENGMTGIMGDIKAGQTYIFLA